MKARDSQTGLFKEVFVKALDSLPVGSEIDFDGDVSDIPVGWEQVDGKSLVSYTLYENSSGTQSSITLSDDINNYDYIEIYGFSNIWGSPTLYAKSDLSKDKIALSTFVSVSGTSGAYFGYISATLNVNKTQSIITITDNYVISNTGDKDQNKVYVTKVIGYKEV